VVELRCRVTLYRLLPVQDDRFIHPDNAWRREVLGKHFCSECCRVLRHAYPTPVDAKLDEIPQGTSADAVFGASVGLIHVRLLDVLLPHMGGFAFGTCYRGDGEIIVVMYDWEGDPYILSRELSKDHLYHDSICCLYVDEWLASTVDWGRFKDLELYPFPVLDKPLDGFQLPGDPDWSSYEPGGQDDLRSTG
jgi:hypothetical protein